MKIPVPGYRESGRGPTVVCIHGSASSSGQWRPLMDRLSDRFRIIAPDLYGHGHTLPWNNRQAMRVDDEVDLLDAAFSLADDKFHLIGHSWGGAIAMKAALSRLPRLLSLTLYEPALWSLLVAHDPSSPGAREIELNRNKTQQLMDEKDFAGAGKYFIDYWVGPGAWELMTDSRRSAFTAGMAAASPEWRASFHETTPLDAFAVINVPTLLLTGAKSTAPARAMTALISGVLTHAVVVELKDIGHMGPVTHPETVNSAIEAFLLKI